MTSPSRRKRPTTQPSTLRWSISSLHTVFGRRVVTCALIAACSLATSAALTSSLSAKDPLERLRKRSAEKDWKKLQERYQPEEPSLLPAVPPAPPRPAPTTIRDEARPHAPAPLQQNAVRSTAPAPLTPDFLPAKSLPSEQGLTAQPAPLNNAAFPDDTIQTRPVHTQSGPNVRGAVSSTQPDRDFLLPGFRPPETDPTQLSKVTSISPFFDYEPDPDLRVKDPLRNICEEPACLDCEGKEEYRCPPVYFKENGDLTRNFAPVNYQWTATNLHYNPLYFEDFTLERYGHDHHPLVQPFISVGKFSGQLLGLPYQMALHPPCEEVFPLGYYRPGEPTPRLIYQVPLNAEAAAVTAGVYTGLFFILP